MLLSEAIGLGSLLLKPKRGALLTKDESSGCALGMAGKAMGVVLRVPSSATAATDETYVALHRTWPWLLDTIKNYPCGCDPDDKHNYQDVITHLFDYHVLAKNQHVIRWTLDQLIAWVRAVEPAESTVAESCTQSELVVT